MRSTRGEVIESALSPTSGWDEVQFGPVIRAAQRTRSTRWRRCAGPRPKSAPRPVGAGNLNVAPVVAQGDQPPAAGRHREPSPDPCWNLHGAAEIFRGWCCHTCRGAAPLQRSTSDRQYVIARMVAALTPELRAEDPADPGRAVQGAARRPDGSSGLFSDRGMIVCTVSLFTGAAVHPQRGHATLGISVIWGAITL